ncbi:hypothetical protein [Croceiramulus getboli]|nr:hypothetical protein P8624_09340 [Flavobacteriaceae bacterium YJPT1-3]
MSTTFNPLYAITKLFTRRSSMKEKRKRHRLKKLSDQLHLLSRKDRWQKPNLF